MNLHFRSPKIQAEYEKTLAMMISLQEFIDINEKPEIIQPKIAQPKFRTLAKGNGIAEIREYPPVRRTISICGQYFTLQFPYIIFTITNNMLHLFFSKHPITNLNDSIWYATLPNVFPQDHYVCCSIDDYSMKEFVDAFWKTEFRSTHYTHQECTDGLKINFGRFHEWEKLSLKEVTERLKFVPFGDLSRASKHDKDRMKNQVATTFGQFLEMGYRKRINWELAKDVSK